LIFLAVFVCCFVVWKAIEWLRNRKVSAPARGTTSVEADAGPAADARTDLSPFEAGNMRDLEDPRNPYDPTFAPSWAQYADEGSTMAGMNQREEEEFFLAFGTRKHRKAIKERRKAREQAQKHQNKSQAL
jgi:hypothetical protein